MARIPENSESVDCTHRPDLSRQRYYRSHPSTSGDEIVISGMSGRYPKAKNVTQFEYNIYNGVDVFEDMSTRFGPLDQQIPSRCGFIADIDKFDAGFFGIHPEHARDMDPSGRLVLEEAFKAVADAGYNPMSLHNKKIGVYVAASQYSAKEFSVLNDTKHNSSAIAGASRTMYANRISYFLGLTGPSLFLDVGCSGSLYAVDIGYSAMRSDEIDGAIVVGINLILHPNTSLCFAKYGILSSTSASCPFDKNADGYVRSEVVTAMYLQRCRDARRVYCTLVHSKTNSDGFKPEGISFPSRQGHQKLFIDFYEEIDVRPEDIGFFEAHAAGTRVGNIEECCAIDSFFCKSRSEPLLVGSVKSIIGHAEPAAALVSISKVILAFQNGIISPNINYNEPSTEIPGLCKNRMQVVTKATAVKNPYAAVNSFGFGGTNGHILLQQFEKDKVFKGINEQDLPVLFLWSGRTQATIENTFSKLESQPLDREYIALLAAVQSGGIPRMVYRGYDILQGQGQDRPRIMEKHIAPCSNSSRPVVWIFSGMGSQWPQMAAELMAIPIFRDSIQQSHQVLQQKNINLLYTLNEADSAVLENPLYSMSAITAMQIALIDVLRSLNLKPDYIVGHSLGEIAAGYFDGCLTREQALLSSYYRGKITNDECEVKGSMAAVALSYKEITGILPNSIDVACHNSPNSCTISGPVDDINQFVEQLTLKNIFTKPVVLINFAFHSRYISKLKIPYQKYLDAVIPYPKRRSARWLSTSVPHHDWANTNAQYLSPEYLANNFAGSVLFEETLALLPEDTLTIEIAPSCLMQAVLKDALPNAVHIGLTRRSAKDHLVFFLTALGKLYENGLNPTIEVLYPTVDWPVSRGTDTISNLIELNHSVEYDSIITTASVKANGGQVFQLNLRDDEHKYLLGHIIDRKTTLPPSLFIEYIWKAFANISGVPNCEDMSIELQNVDILRTVDANVDCDIVVTVHIHPKTGNFEVEDSNGLIMTGVVHEIVDAEKPSEIFLAAFENKYYDEFYLNAQDFYKELVLRGFHYKDDFKGVRSVRGDGQSASIRWDNNWVTFLDNLLQLHIIDKDSRDPYVPRKIRTLRIFSRYHLDTVNDIFVKVHRSDYDKTTIGGGVELTDVETIRVQRQRPSKTPVLDRYKFTPHFPSPTLATSEICKVFLQIIYETHFVGKFKIIELITDCNQKPIIQHFSKAVDASPLVEANYVLLTRFKHDHLPENTRVVEPNPLEYSVGNVIITKHIDDLEKDIDKMPDNVFIIVSFKLDADHCKLRGFSLLAQCPQEGTDSSLVFLWRHSALKDDNMKYLRISSNDTNFTWLKTAQNILETNNLTIIADNDRYNGVLALKHTLTKEYLANKIIKCVIIDDPSAPPFDPQNKFYAKQLSRGMSVNIYRQGQWGTYRFLPLVSDNSIAPYSGQIYSQIQHHGDDQKVSWLQGKLSPHSKSHIKVIYSSLTYKDVMLVTGGLSIEVEDVKRLKQTSVLGSEFAGIDLLTGKRIMGVSLDGSLASHISEPSWLTMEVPDTWSFQEAATIPLSYFAVYYTFFHRTNLLDGQNILIHNGTSDIGLSAIRIALWYGLEVFATVNTLKKKLYLEERFPNLRGCYVDNDRKNSFQRVIKMSTDGKGVDFILNPITKSDITKTTACLAKFGVFIEIRHFSTPQSKPTYSTFLSHDATFISIALDQALLSAKGSVQKNILEKLGNDIKRGIIDPLPTSYFEAGAIDQALLLLEDDHHIGKVLVKMYESPESSATVPLQVIPRVYFSHEMVYVIPGGLGGFGLEFIDWMITRGARKIVISSTRGISSGYQYFRIKLWKSYGCNIVTHSPGVSNRETCEELLKVAKTLGPIGGIFNLAVSLNDAMFNNLTVESFVKTFKPKAYATKNLDKLIRNENPSIPYFVAFSSLTGSRGNIGQTNYGMSNAVMERIMEDRVKSGLSGKVIQWAPVGDSGLGALTADKVNVSDIAGMLFQPMFSCLEQLDSLLLSSDEIVSSMCVASKSTENSTSMTAFEKVVEVLGIADINSVPLDATLPQLGMDSLLGFKIAQLLEKDFKILLSPQDLRLLTLQTLHKLSRGTTEENDCIKAIQENDIRDNLSMVYGLSDESFYGQDLVPLNDIKSHESPVIFFSGLESSCGPVWMKLGKDITVPAFAVQLHRTSEMTTLDDICSFVLSKVKGLWKKDQPYRIVAYSFGAIFGLKVAGLLEQQGFQGKLLILDSSHTYISRFFNAFYEDTTKDDRSAVMLWYIIKIILPNCDVTLDGLKRLKTLNERMAMFKKYAALQTVFSTPFMMSQAIGAFHRSCIAHELSLSSFEKLNAPICLVKPTNLMLPNMSLDYDLNSLNDNKVDIKVIAGTHYTILKNPQLGGIITDFMTTF